ncbi:MAG: metabolite traffic protein EboE [Cytophagaceae bacterium]|jgi:hypothetical protein|nr:metabolite traffic protein EboE [Cytophagaceae bacterium]
MEILNHHLTYCTNIHSGEHWVEVFEKIQEYVPKVREEVSPEKPFGIGLRLSNAASIEILQGDALQEFSAWLQDQHLYVFTINGFPFGNFHHSRVKDDVHTPDWTTADRADYTCRLISILSALLPEGIDGSISTSPLSYKPWLMGNEHAIQHCFQKSTQHLLEVLEYAHNNYQQTGKLIHLGLEPEPDGLLENSREYIAYLNEYLLPQSSAKWGSSACEIVRRHLKLCYDVCHFAIEFENPADTFAALKAANVDIGKIQLSAALKVNLAHNKSEILEHLMPFVDSTYLHQVIERDENGKLHHYPDLPEALSVLALKQRGEWRTHFHVPLFLERYHVLESTQAALLEVLEQLPQLGYAPHLEIETYTWEVLPDDLKQDLTECIIRECNWVKKNMERIVCIKL